MAIRTVSGIVYIDSKTKQEINSVEISKGKYASPIVYAEIPSERLVPYNQITSGKATIEKVIISFKSANVQTNLCDSGGTNQYASYTSNADCQYILTKANSLKRINNEDAIDTGKALNKISEDWNNKNYYLAFRLKSNDTKGYTISNISYTIYYDFKTTAVQPPSSVRIADQNQVIVAQESAVLSFKAGKNGQDNSVRGYQIQYRVSDSTTFGQIQWSDYLQIECTTDVQSVVQNVSPNGNRGQYTQYRVRSLGRTDLEDQYNSKYVVASGLIRYNTIPSSPTVKDIHSEVFEQTIGFSWSESQDQTDSVQGYHLYKWTGSTSQSLVVSSNVITIPVCDDRVYSISETARGIYVKYEIRAFDAFEVQSQGSFTKLHRKNTAPYHLNEEKMSLSSYLYTGGEITISWDAAHDETSSTKKPEGYKIQLRNRTDNSDSTWSTISNVSTTEYKTTLYYSKGTYVDFRVIAYDGFGISDTPYDYVTACINIQPVVGKSFTATPEKYSSDDPTVYESGNINLVWSKATSKFSSIKSYKYSYAIKNDDGTYGQQSQPTEMKVTLTDSSMSYKIPSLNIERGKTARIRLYAYDSVGYMSEYPACYIFRNVIPCVPSLVYPKSRIHSPHSLIVVKIDRSQTKLKRKMLITSGTSSKTVENISVDEQNVAFYIDDGIDGDVIVRVADDLDTLGSPKTFSITIQDAAWQRDIQEGSVIADSSTSHQSELLKMLAQANASRVAYGLDAISFKDTIGYFKNWTKNMKQMYDAVKQIYDNQGVACKSFPSYDTNYPRANIINIVREMIEGV